MGVDVPLEQVDPEVARAVEAELERERNSLVMIASENYASRAVIEAQANVMTNKYAEGYPSRRYYGGCENVDVIETLALERARELYKSEYANVQPHSGSQANMAAYLAVLEPGDGILGMHLSHGGHLTHGSPVSFSGRIFQAVFYGLDRGTGTIDYNQVEDMARKHRPGVIIAGASAYPRVIDFAAFRDIAKGVGAFLLVDMAHIAGLVAAGLHPSPIGLADIVTSTTHKTLRGPRGGFILSQESLGDALDKSVFPGIQGGPLMHVIAAKAVAFGEAASQDFRDYQRQVILNARMLAETLLNLGYDLVSGGTDNHLVLIDLTGKGITGLEAEESLGRAGIAVNKNTVPFDTRGPRVTSGLRLGTPALTTRGMTEPEMEHLGHLIHRALGSPGDEAVLNGVRSEVDELCRRFPIYQSFG